MGKWASEFDHDGLELLTFYFQALTLNPTNSMLQIVKPRQVTKPPKVSVSCLLNVTITIITHLGPRLCGPETELVSIIIFPALGFSPGPGVCQGPRSPFFLVHSISQQSGLPKKPRAKYKLTKQSREVLMGTFLAYVQNSKHLLHAVKCIHFSSVQISVFCCPSLY